jgi:tetratricopeptide (TPR) repeat protein
MPRGAWVPSGKAGAAGVGARDDDDDDDRVGDDEAAAASAPAGHRSIAPLDPARLARLSRAQADLVDAGEARAAEHLLRDWIADNPDVDTHIARLELARVLLWRGRPDEARALLDRLREEHPDHGWIASLAGQVAARFGELGRARALFEHALAVDPHNHEARLFLHGDDLEDAARARRMLTHGALPPRGQIEVAALCAALDLRRGRRTSWAHGPLTQASLDRANLMIDAAAVGDDVDAAVSLRPAFVRAARIVYYTSHALGDTLLGLAAVDALARFFSLHPEARRPVEVVSPYAALLDGVAAAHPFVSVRRLCSARDPDEGHIYAADLARRDEPTLALVNSAPFVSEALLAVARARAEVVEVVDLLVDRYTRDLAPWPSLGPPRGLISSYPARLHRFMEIALGCRLAARPADVSVALPVTDAVTRRQELLLRRHDLDGAGYHCVIEAASKRSKAFTPSLLGPFLCEAARALADDERAGARRQRIVFGTDSRMTGSFAPLLCELPAEVRARIVCVEEDLVGMAAILARADTVVATDTGLAHLAGALGRPTLMVYTMADPWLWRTGGANVRALWSPQAMAAHVNRTPVNMPEWDTPHPVMDQSLTVRDLRDAWLRCRDGRSDGRGDTTFSLRR